MVQFFLFYECHLARVEICDRGKLRRRRRRKEVRRGKFRGAASAAVVPQCHLVFMYRYADRARETRLYAPGHTE